MIETERLLLRRWEDRDRAEFHRHCSDVRVMEFLGPLLSAEEADAVLQRHTGYLDSHGYGFLAMERKQDGALLGFCGLKPGAPDTPIAGEVEIGWRLGHDHWGRGYAREAAQAGLEWGWAKLDAQHIAAITTRDNRRSRKLMERLGMIRSAADDFDHPLAVEALKPHVTYRISRAVAAGG